MSPPLFCNLACDVIFMLSFLSLCISIVPELVEGKQITELRALGHHVAVTLPVLVLSACWRGPRFQSLTVCCLLSPRSCGGGRGLSPGPWLCDKLEPQEGPVCKNS